MRYAAFQTALRKMQMTTTAQPSSHQLLVETAWAKTKPIRYVRAAAGAFTDAP